MESHVLPPARAALALALLLLSPFVAPLALASPYGTTYTATAVNFPGSATGTLEFDGVEEPLGTSGLIVGESATTFSGFELLEFSLRTADGNPFVGQQLSATDPASVDVSDLFWYGDPDPAAAIAESAFLWLSIDGAPQALSDVLNVGFVFGTHPLDLSIPVLFVDNVASTTFGFGTFGASAFDTFGLLVGPTVAAQINDVHFGVAAAPVAVPEPGTGLLLSLGLLGPLLARPRVRRLAGMLACYAVAGFAWSGTLGCPRSHDSTTIYGGMETGVITNDPALGAAVAVECSRPVIGGSPIPTCPGGTYLPDDEGSYYVACLTATPAASFQGWTCSCQTPSEFPVGCGGPNQCELRVYQNTTVACDAIFCPGLQLTVSVDGTGTVTSDVGGIDCSSGGQGTCAAPYCLDSNGDPAVVKLTPSARVGSGYLFDGWTGDPDCDDGSVMMLDNVDCEATFRQPLVSVEVIGEGKVTGSVNGQQIDCSDISPSCSASVPLNGQATLSAAADPGAQFDGWSGDCPDGDTFSTVSMTFSPVSMSADKTCIATFSFAGGPGVSEIVSLADDETRGDASVEVGFLTEQISGSADLSVVAFRSLATNLLGSPAQPPWQGYVRDLAAQTTRRYSDANDGSTGGIALVSLSADGLFVAYEYVSPLDPVSATHIYRRDLRTDEEVLISVYDPSAQIGFNQVGAGRSPALSGNGRYVAYWTAIGAGFGIVVRDTCTGAPPADACTPHFVVVSYDPDGLLVYESQTGPPRISRDGRFVLFRGVRASSPGQYELLLRDRDTDADGVFDEANLVDTIEVLPDPTGGTIDLSSWTHDLDASGRYVAFETNDLDLPGNPDPQPFYGRAWLRDTCAGVPSPPCSPTYTLLSVRDDGTAIDSNGFTIFSDLGGSGRYVAFDSDDGLMVSSDPDLFNSRQQSVLRDTCIGATTGPGIPPCDPGNLLISRTGSGAPLFNDALLPLVSDDGSRAIFLGRRRAVAPLDSVPLRWEVLTAVTEVVADPGGVPVLSNRSPASVDAPSPELLLTITGSGFVPGTRVLWKPSSAPAALSRDAIFISPTKLQLRLEEAELATATVFTFKILNPSGSSSTNQLSFRVD